MPAMNISVSHQLGREEATRRLKLKHAEIKANQTYTVTDLTETWTSPDSMDFAFRVFGFSLTGSVASLENAVDIAVDLPVAAMPLKGTIESQVRKELAQVLATG